MLRTRSSGARVFSTKSSTERNMLSWVSFLTQGSILCPEGRRMTWPGVKFKTFILFLQFWLQRQHDGRDDKDGRIRSHHKPDHQAQGKGIEDLAAVKVKRHNDQGGGEGRQDGPAQRLINAFVNDLFEALAPELEHVLAHAVVNDDGVINGIARDRQKRDR